jgi:hypothetical protein
MKKILITPEGTFEIELTAAEIAQRQLDEQQAIAAQQARDSAAAAKAAAEQSAINKLKALGLTDAEVQAFRGK